MGESAAAGGRSWDLIEQVRQWRSHLNLRVLHRAFLQGVCVGVCVCVYEKESERARACTCVCGESVGGGFLGRGLLLGEGDGRASVAKWLVVSVSCLHTVYP